MVDGHTYRMVQLPNGEIQPVQVLGKVGGFQGLGQGTTTATATATAMQAQSIQQQQNLQQAMAQQQLQQHHLHLLPGDYAQQHHVIRGNQVAPLNMGQQNITAAQGGQVSGGQGQVSGGAAGRVETI